MSLEFILFLSVMGFFILVGIGGIIAAYKDNKILNELDAETRDPEQ